MGFKNNLRRSIQSYAVNHNLNHSLSISGAVSLFMVLYSAGVCVNPSIVGLSTCERIISMFNSVSTTVHKQSVPWTIVTL